MKYRDLEKVRLIIHEATGLDVSYAYDDLVFPDHTAFLLRFDMHALNMLHCYFRQECSEGDKDILLLKIMKAGENHNCQIKDSGVFSMEQEGEQVQIKFN